MANPAIAQEAAFPWPAGRLDSSPGTRCLEIGQRTVLFCERRQELFELNTTAAAIWRSLAAGDTPAATVQVLCAQGASADDARQFVIASARAWLEAGLLLPAQVAARARRPPDARMHLRLGRLACALGIHTPAGSPFQEELHQVFGQFIGEPGQATLRMDVVGEADQAFLLLDGVSLGLFSADRLVPEVKAVLTQALSQSMDEGSFLIHAAMLERRGQGLLISGQPGAGKTTLALALAARGWGYGSDDIVSVSPAGQFTGVPFSPAVKSGAWELARDYAPHLDARPDHLRADGQRVRFLPVRAPFAAVAALGWAVILDRRLDAEPVLEPVDPLAVVSALIAGAYSPGHRLRADAFENLVDSIAPIPCRRLVYGDLAQAVALIEGMVGE